MQKQLNEAEKLILNPKNQTDTQGTSYWRGISALGLAHLDWKRGIEMLRNIFRQSNSYGFLDQHQQVCQPPLLGSLLAGFYEIASDEESANAFLREFFPAVLNFHRYLYLNRDPEEEGLLAITYPEKKLLWTTTEGERSSSPENMKIQDPFFNAMVVWSNECLMEIGTHLGENMEEIILWNELTIFSFNEKLWDQEWAAYRSYDLHQQKFLPKDILPGVLPLIGEIPDQDRAELLLKHLKKQYFGHWFPTAGDEPASPHRPEVSIIFNWLLYHGCWRFGMLAAADRIRQHSLGLMDRYGFLEKYPSDINTTLDTSSSSLFLPAAALYIIWSEEQ